ncbi:XRE family transcriptional regulator [Lentzea sp. NPDC042327]|uniref:XRE family transcriptional regulator n=1 Tax=Lentzea sp. NPDC042327 TaxID=3154801 RepID=UPI0033CD9FCF
MSQEVGRERLASFAEALDAAITASGLTLDRVRHRLAEQGTEIGIATLSYWRRGHRRPEGPESLRAVQLLERVLGLPPASLVVLLGAPRPRGRWVTRPDSPHVAPLVAELDDPDEGRCGLVSAHDVFTVRADRTERGVRSRVVLRGLSGLVHRYLVRYEADEPGTTPALTAVDFCRVGRTVVDAASGLIVAELLLDRPLKPGEHTVVEYGLCAPPGPPVEFYSRRLRSPVGEYAQLVRFEGDPPAGGHTFRKDGPAAPEHTTEPLHVGASGTSALVVHDVRPCVVGTRWHW